MKGFSATMFLVGAVLSTTVVAQSNQNNITSLTGTWSSGSGSVVTGSGFADPMNANRPFIFPKNPGISYSFTDDGYFEEAQYRYHGNGSDPDCAYAVILWQHGRYNLHSNGSLTLEPGIFAADGRVQVQDPCGATSETITYYNQFTLYKQWTMSIDLQHATYMLQLYEWDGTPLPRLYLTMRPPNMLPTKSLTSYYNGTAQLNNEQSSNNKATSEIAQVDTFEVLERRAPKDDSKKRLNHDDQVQL